MIRPDNVIRLYFATAYNKFGEEGSWDQGRVKQFFGHDELLIGRDFWNFICDDTKGNAMVLNAYKQHAPILKAALEDIILTVKQNVETHEESLWQNTELD